MHVVQTKAESLVVWTANVNMLCGYDTTQSFEYDEVGCAAVC